MLSRRRFFIFSAGKMVKGGHLLKKSAFGKIKTRLNVVSNGHYGQENTADHDNFTYLAKELNTFNAENRPSFLCSVETQFMTDRVSWSGQSASRPPGRALLR